MAIFNEIQVGRFNRWLQKATGIKGGAPVKQLGSELMPVITAFYGVEDRYLSSWQRYRFGILNGPIAAQNSGIRFRNPVASNVMMVLESILCVAAPGDTASFIGISRGQATTDLDTGTGLLLNSREDPRGSQAATAIMSINTVALVNLTNSTVLASIACATPSTVQVITTDNQELLVMPGDAIQFGQGNAVNQNIRVQLVWRERSIEDSERT